MLLRHRYIFSVDGLVAIHQFSKLTNLHVWALQAGNIFSNKCTQNQSRNLPDGHAVWGQLFLAGTDFVGSCQSHNMSQLFAALYALTANCNKVVNI